MLNKLMNAVESMEQQRTGKVILRTHEIDDLPTLKIDAELIRDIREKLHVSRVVFTRRLRVSAHKS